MSTRRSSRIRNAPIGVRGGDVLSISEIYQVHEARRIDRLSMSNYSCKGAFETYSSKLVYHLKKLEVQVTLEHWKHL
jgi:hypothetical protein